MLFAIQAGERRAPVPRAAPRGRDCAMRETGVSRVSVPARLGTRRSAPRVSPLACGVGPCSVHRAPRWCINVRILQLYYVTPLWVGREQNSKTYKRAVTSPVTGFEHALDQSSEHHTICRHTLTVPASSHTGRISLRARASAHRNDGHAGLPPKRDRHQRKGRRAACCRATR